MPNIESLYDLARCDNCEVSSCNARLRYHNDTRLLVQSISELSIHSAQEPPDSLKMDATVEVHSRFADANEFIAAYRILSPDCRFDDAALVKLLEGADYYFNFIETSGGNS